MKSVFPSIAATFLCVPAALSAPDPASFRDAEIVPAPGEYVVLISEKTAARADWKAAADEFVARYAGTLVRWDGNDADAARDALRRLQPRYVAVVAAPEEIDRVLIASLHRISREMNDDVYGDFLWGVVTGKNGEEAAKQLAKDEPLMLERAIGTTNFDQGRFRRSFFVTDWSPRQFVETENFLSSEKKFAEPGAEMAEMFAARWEKIRPQFVISASHATEFNLEMPFGEGLIFSAGGNFHVAKKSLLPEFAEQLKTPKTLPEFAREKNLAAFPKTPDEKIWIAAGNCLFGDMFRTADSMAGTAISAQNVRQLVGYTVPSWFGEIGWGTNDKFFNGHQTTSVGQAWFFATQLLLNGLPENAARIPVPLTATDMSGITFEATVDLLRKNGVALTRENVGRVYDRDVVAFYGDPLFRARFSPDALSVPPWDCRVATEGDAQIFAVRGARGNAVKKDFCLWFPRRFDATKTLKIEGAAIVPEPTILTENFVVFRDLELAAGETLTLTVPEKK